MGIYIGDVAVGAGSGGGGTVIQGTGLLPIDNIAALRSVSSPVNGQLVYVKGHTTSGDGGGGVFEWVAADARKMVASVTISAAGTGYIVGTEIYPHSTVNQPARWQVTAVNATGGVTALRMLDPGKYTTDPTLVGAATRSHIIGTGCTLNITMGSLDNNGTIIAKTGTPTGRWIRHFSGNVDIRWFGAKGDGIADDVDAIQAAIAAQARYSTAYIQWIYGGIYIPNGVFRVGNSIIPLSGTQIVGESMRGSIISGATGLTVPIIQTNPKLTQAQRDNNDWTYRKRIVIENIELLGNGLHALQIVSNTESSIRFLSLRVGTTSHCIYLEDSWNFTMFNVIALSSSSSQATDGAILYLGRDVNATTISRFDTSSATPYGIFQGGEGSGANVAGHGVSFRDCCLQGHSVAGIFIRTNGYGGTTIDNLYTENVAQAIVMGTETTAQVARGVSIIGGILGVANDSNGKGVIVLWRAEGITISGCIMEGRATKPPLAIGLVRRMFVNASPGYTSQWFWNLATGTPTSSKVQLLGTNSTNYARKPEGILIVDGHTPAGGGGWMGSAIWTMGTSATGNNRKTVTKIWIDDDTATPTLMMERGILPIIGYNTNGPVL